MTLKNILDETYEQLHRHNLVSTQYEFSRKWLKRSDGYYAYLRSTGAETTGDVALALWAECRKQKQQWRSLIGRPAAVSEFGRGLKYKAPEFVTGMTWINSPPLTMQSLRGKVVILHFYAYG